jgi:hypothetical protein
MPTAKSFYKNAGRAERGVERTPVHILLTKAQRDKLAKLSNKQRISAAEVIRRLLEAA